jgi:hypothetical protein
MPTVATIPKRETLTLPSLAFSSRTVHTPKAIKAIEATKEIESMGTISVKS